MSIAFMSLAGTPAIIVFSSINDFVTTEFAPIAVLLAILMYLHAWRQVHVVSDLRSLICSGGGAYVRAGVDTTVGANLGILIHDDRAVMGDRQTRSENVFRNSKPQPKGQPFT